AVHGHELADRDRDGAGLGGKAEELALEVGVTLDLRLRNQAVDRIVELGCDRDRVGALHRRLDHERGRHVTHVGGVVVQRFDQLLAATGDRDHNEIESLAGKELLTLGDQQRQREDAAQRRERLPVADRDILGGSLAAQRKAERCSDRRRGNPMRDVLRHVPCHGMFLPVLSSLSRAPIQAPNLARTVAALVWSARTVMATLPSSRTALVRTSVLRWSQLMPAPSAPSSTRSSTMRLEAMRASISRMSRSSPSPVRADTSTAGRPARSARLASRSRPAASRRSILFHTSMSCSPGSTPSCRSTVSTSCDCASLSSCETSRTCRITSAATTSSSVARKAATSVVGRSEMKPTVSERMIFAPCGRSSARMVGSSVANS